MSIVYIRADATQPHGEGNKIIAHVCNDIGRWGKGFVLALSRRSSEPEKAYRLWYENRHSNDFALGAVQFVSIADDIWVANIIGQHKIKVKGKEGIPPIRYEAIETGLAKLAEKALELKASVYMPRIGCGLAGGKWEIIEEIVIEKLCFRGIEVAVCDRR